MFDSIMRSKCIFDEAETKCERSEQSWGSGGLPPGKILVATPFRLLENAPFWRIYHLKKQSIMSDGSPSWKIYENDCNFTSRYISIELHNIQRNSLIDSGNLLE